MPVNASEPLLRRRVRLPVLVALLAVLLLPACEVRSRIEVVADRDGSGRVAVLVGLDRAALDRLGDPATGLALDDLATAGWRVDGPVEHEGRTWWRAAKPFAGPDELQPTIDELAGPEGPLAGFRFEEADVEGGTRHRLTGEVDLSAGLDALAEPELTETLGGDPFGGYVEALEAEEGRPVRDMLSVQVAAVVEGEGHVVDLRPGDGPVVLTADRHVEAQSLPWPILLAAAVAVTTAVAVGVELRRRGRRHAAR